MLFGVLLAATLLIGVGVVLRTLWMGRDLAAFPFVLSFMWLYFYAYMAIHAWVSLEDYLPPWTLEFGQGMAFLALVALHFGWRAATTRGSSRRAPSQPFELAGISPRRLWWIGIGFVFLGAAAYHLFIARPAPNWDETSAYWYMLFHLSYPGTGLALIASAAEPRLRLWPHRLLFAAAVLYAMYPHVVSARRGPIFPMVIVLLFVPVLTGRRRSRLVVAGGLVAVGSAMLLFVAVRPWLYENGVYAWAGSEERWRGALAEQSLDSVFVDRVRQVGDNEYVYHCAMIATLVERGCYQYGTGYASTMLNWIPRGLWPDKPILGEGWFSPSVHDEMPVVMGWQMTTGAAAGGVAEVFNQFGVFSVIFWGILGYGVAKLYASVSGRPSASAVSAYVGVLCASHWLVSQGFAAAFVPAAIYQAVPLVAYRLARSGRDARDPSAPG